jgi:hypothetical protein
MNTDSKSVLLVTVILLCLPIFTHAQATPVKRSLVLSTSIISREYPRNNVVEMKLRLRFTNTGNRPLILYKPSILVTGIGVFEDVERPNRDTFAQVSALISDPPREIPYEEIVKSRPNNDFITIAPSKSYEMEESVSTQIRARNRKQANGANDDRYLLTIKVSTWDASRKELAARLRRKWQRLGVLWSEVIESKPMSFRVEREQANAK